MIRKLFISLTIISVTAPALADRGNGGGFGAGLGIGLATGAVTGAAVAATRRPKNYYYIDQGASSRGAERAKECQFRRHNARIDAKRTAQSQAEFDAMMRQIDNEYDSCMSYAY